jgi:hypothetical protein
MIAIAESLSTRIGVYMRIDMFRVGQNLYVQEYSGNPMNGLRHCAAKLDENGCVDSCFLGRSWKAAGSPYGGAPTSTPPDLLGFGQKSIEEQCSLVDGVTAVSNFVSSCSSS